MKKGKVKERGRCGGKTVRTELELSLHENNQDIRCLVPILQGARKHREKSPIDPVTLVYKKIKVD